MAEPTAEDDIQPIELGPWRVTARINKKRNLTVEVELDGEDHANVIMQEGGKVELETKARPKDVGEKGLVVSNASSEDIRRFWFEPPPASSE